ncbi:2-phospho-L-lactate transferase [bacterium]|nr:2-phospho-L-lactate transferase [bacterium]
MDISSDHSAAPGQESQSPTLVLLSGGVGGARLAQGLEDIPGVAITVIANVGDDEEMYGVHVSADLDTVLYTLAGRQGPHGWGMAGDTFRVMDHLADLGVDTSFRLGDTDLATCLRRTMALEGGASLSEITAEITAAFGIRSRLLPATDDRLRTRVQTPDGEWLAFQDYFVLRKHKDRVMDLEYQGGETALPAPGVIEAIESASAVLLAPSNPPLSVWPILAVHGIRDAIAAHDRVVAVSPLFAGRALKGPAAEVMDSLGLPPGTAGILEAYEGLLTDLVIDIGDAADVALHGDGSVSLHAADTRIADRAASRRFAQMLIEEIL